MAGAADPADLGLGARRDTVGIGIGIGAGVDFGTDALAGREYGPSRLQRHGVVGQADAKILRAEVIQLAVQIGIFRRNGLSGWNGIQQAVRYSGGAGTVDGVFQTGVAGFGVDCINLGAVGIGHHAAAVGEVKYVTVLRDVIDRLAADAGLASQPLLQVAYIDFDHVHDAGGSATIVAGDGIARFAFARVIDIDGIPVILRGALVARGLGTVAVPGAEGGSVDGHLGRFGWVRSPSGLGADSKDFLGASGGVAVRRAGGIGCAVIVAVGGLLEEQNGVRANGISTGNGGRQVCPGKAQTQPFLSYRVIDASGVAILNS